MDSELRYEPIYTCPLKGCDAFVIGFEGAFWSCGWHGKLMVLRNQKLLAAPKQEAEE